VSLLKPFVGIVFVSLLFHCTLFHYMYMEQPPGYAENNLNTHVCKLQRSIYGLKQASRSWFDSLSLAIQKHGFLRSHLDHSLFFFRDHQVTTLLIYVDDIVITRNSKDHIEVTKALLSQKFKMKDLGNLRYFLGIEVDRQGERLFLTQHKYTLDLLYKTANPFLPLVFSIISLVLRMENHMQIPHTTATL
jgi:hypothetical protein